MSGHKLEVASLFASGLGKVAFWSVYHSFVGGR